MNIITYTKKHKKNVLITILLAVLIVLSVWVYIHSIERNFVTKATEMIDVQKKSLSETALATVKESATGDIDAIVTDCSVKNRALFDTQLSNLQQLHGQQLVEVDQLFAACGNYFAEKKAVMVLTLANKLQTYSDLIALLQTMDNSTNPDTFALDSWQKLVALEKKQSELSLHLVTVQGEIIATLRNNVPVTDDGVQTLSVEGQRTRNELDGLSKDINTVAQKLGLL